MTTPKRPPGKFAAPLPLLTQPMIPLERGPTDDDPGATAVGGPGALHPDAASVLFGRPTVSMAAMPRGGGVVGVGAAAFGPAVPAGGSGAGASGPVVSSLPTAPPEIGLTQHAVPGDNLDPRLALVIDPDSERAAAFRILRHHLLEVGRPQVIIVSSPQAGDGKTTTALNLALALAECGRARVLLVETHLRRPQLAGVFKFIPPWCFAEQLAAHRHQPMMPWSLVEIPQLWLHVAAINPRLEQTQLLDGPAFAIAMERLRLAGYDHIVVDAPPVLGSADVNLMADAADAVLMSLRARRSTTRDLRRAIEQIGASKVVGTVLVEPTA